MRPTFRPASRYPQVTTLIFQVSKKPTKHEKMFRVDAVYSMLCDGLPRYIIVQKAAEKWQVGERTADNYIAEARVKIEADCQMSRQAFMAEALAGYRSIRQKAEKRGQLMCAKQCLDAQTALVGLNQKQ